MAQINTPLDIVSLGTTAQFIDKKGNIILDVVSKNASSTCHKCGKPAIICNSVAPTRLIRHLSILDTPVYLRITPIRYSCEYCDGSPTTTEQCDWCDRNASAIKSLENYIIRCLINSTIEDVAKKENIGQRVIQSALDRQVKKEVDWTKNKNLETIGIDETPMKKGYQTYVTVISMKSKEEGPRVVAVLEGREKEDVKSFLQSIPNELKKTINQVFTDMYDDYINAAIEIFGVQCLVIDRYRVSKLYRKPLDNLRVKEMARLKSELSSEDYAKLEGMMWILRKKYECLSEVDKNKLAFLYKYSLILKKAHSYALRLTHIFNTHSNKKSAMAKIARWIISIEKSNLNIFNLFITTLNKYKSYIGNYFKACKNSGFVEGLNNKFKVAKRCCYGFVKTQSLFQRLFLDLQGFDAMHKQLPTESQESQVDDKYNLATTLVTVC